MATSVKTTRIRKGEYKIEYKGEFVFAMMYDDGTWGLYEDKERKEWIDFFRKTPTLKSCKKALIFMTDN